MRMEISGCGCLCIFIVGILILNAGPLMYNYGNARQLEMVVQDKYIKDNMYYVADDEGNAYKITDLPLLFKWDSTDIYNSLEIGEEYEIETTGFRIPFLSEYPNINEVKEKKDV